MVPIYTGEAEVAVYGRIAEALPDCSSKYLKPDEPKKSLHVLWAPAVPMAMGEGDCGCVSGRE